MCSYEDFEGGLTFLAEADRPASDLEQAQCVDALVNASVR